VQSSIMQIIINDYASACPHSQRLFEVILRIQKQ
jgi:hypothetical protein